MIKTIFLNYYFLILLYRVLLDIAYIKTTNYYSDVGFTYSPEDILPIIATYIIMLLFALFQKKDYTPSSIILFILFLLNVIPAFTLFSYSSDYSSFGVVYISMAYGSVLLSMNFVNFLKIESDKRDLDMRLFVFLLIMIYFFAIIILIKHFGIKFSLPSLDNVYDTRADFKEHITRGIGYLFNWFGSILNPFVFLLALRKKKITIVIISLLFQFYLFSIGGHKTILFTLLVVFGIYIFLEFYKKILLQKLILFGIIFLISTLLIYDFIVGGYSLMTAVIVQRVFLIPAQMYYWYIDFFQINPIDYFGQNFPFSLFVESHYELPIPATIGDYHLDRPDVYANANIFADAYANLGYWGIVFITYVFTLTFYIFDNISRKKDTSIIIPIIILLSFTMVNASLLTSLVTFGILFFMLLVFFLPKKNYMQSVF